ncbi:MAG: hypothetical protein LCH38_12335 [Proteobacteria bacterium]|nr:hypothetical protein [Pseudomonadota bacterium]
MLLGTLLGKLQSEVASAALLEATGDLVLIARVREMGEVHDESLGEYASGAAARFSRLASDEDWLALMNRIERAEDPSSACLVFMLDWALKQDVASAVPAPAHAGCTCGGGGGCHDSP